MIEGVLQNFEALVGSRAKKNWANSGKFESRRSLGIVEANTT